MTNIPGDFPGMPGPSNTAEARQQVNTPAILLMVVAGLSIAYGLFSLVTSLTGGGIPAELLNDPKFQEFRPWMERSQSFGAIGPLFQIALNGVVLFGALKMKNLENFGLSMAAAIIACIPCCSCCCLGIPVGIWALVVLNKPEVKSAFR
jgi:hypothetical protein